MYPNFCMYTIQMIEKCPSPFSIHLLAITCISNFIFALYHVILQVNTITCTIRIPYTQLNITSQLSPTIVDDLRRFTEIPKHLLKFCGVGVLIICSIVQTAGSTCNQYIIKRNNAWFCPYLQCTDKMHVILHLDCEPMTL